jgi:ubiquitin-large subunit ribosomal protein L40e
LEEYQKLKEKIQNELPKKDVKSMVKYLRKGGREQFNAVKKSESKLKRTIDLCLCDLKKRKADLDALQIRVAQKMNDFGLSGVDLMEVMKTMSSMIGRCETLFLMMRKNDEERRSEIAAVQAEVDEAKSTLRNFSYPNGGIPEIFLKTLRGTTVSLEYCVRPTDTIDTLKAVIEEIEHIPPDQQTLFFRGKELGCWGRCVGDYGIEVMSELHMRLRLRGGGESGHIADYATITVPEKNSTNVGLDTEIRITLGNQVTAVDAAKAIQVI